MITTHRTLPLFKSPEIVDNFDLEHRIVLHCGDTLDFLKILPDETAKPIITSPPYNLGKQYESKTQIELYLDFQDQILPSAFN